MDIQTNTEAKTAQSNSVTPLQATIDQYAQAWASRDVDRIAALHTTDSVFFLNVAGYPPALGREAIRAKFQQILRGNPHYSSTVHRMSWGIDFVVIEYSIRMQPAGQFVLGQHRLKPKSNIAYDIPAIDVIHVEQGLVSAKYTYVDNETVRANSVAADDVSKSRTVIIVKQKGRIMFIKSCWAILALIHAIPAFALFKPSLLTSLYKVQADSVAYALLHHRAALFVGVFVACIWALLQPGSRQLAVIVVGISMISFLVLFALSGMSDSLRLIAIVDLIGIPFLTIAAWQAFRGAKV